MILYCRLYWGTTAHAVGDSQSSNDPVLLPVVRNSNSTPLGFKANSSGVRLISQRLKRKVFEKREGKRVRVPGIEEFVAVDDSEASDAESPRFEAGTGAETPAAGSGVMGTAPTEHAGVEEVREEEPDVHFKRKRADGSRRKQLVKKPRRQAPTIVVEGEPSTTFPPAAPLVVNLSITEPITSEFAPDLGKISSVLAIYLLCVPNSLLFAS